MYCSPSKLSFQFWILYILHICFNNYLQLFLYTIILVNIAI